MPAKRKHHEHTTTLLGNLSRFCILAVALAANAGDHRLLVTDDETNGGVPIRHWDGYWFGGKRLYGDTLHYHAGLSANGSVFAYRVFGDDRWLERARRSFRNCLGLFRADGFGTAAWHLPVTVTLIDRDNRDSDLLGK